MEIKGKVNLKISLEDQDTKNEMTLKLNIFNDENEFEIYKRVCEGVRTLLTEVGVLTHREIKMDTEKKEEQTQDLTHQKPAGGELNKSERPADDYMDTHGLDRDTHEKIKKD